MSIEVGNKLKGKVTGIKKFGAFVELPEGKSGLVHISEVADNYVENVEDHLSVGDVVEVKVLSIADDGKISLSIKKANNSNQNIKSSRPEEIDWSKSDDFEKMSFEDRLAKFLKDSDEKMLDLKKNFESKRGGGGYKKYANY